MRFLSNIILSGYLRLLNLQRVGGNPDLLAVDALGVVRTVPNTFTLSSYQISNISGFNYGQIFLNTFVDNNVGYYNCKIEATFGDINNSTFRLIAKRVVVFSFINFNNIHSEPILNMVEHSGSIVNVTNNAVYDLKPSDIDFETVMSGGKLVVRIKNNLASPYTGAIKCIYSIKIEKFEWMSGGGIEMS